MAKFEPHCRERTASRTSFHNRQSVSKVTMSTAFTHNRDGNWEMEKNVGKSLLLEKNGRKKHFCQDVLFSQYVKY